MTKKRGGKRKNAGNKPLTEKYKEPTIKYEFFMPQSYHAYLQRRTNNIAAYLRQLIADDMQRNAD